MFWNEAIQAWKTSDPAVFSGDLLRPMVTTSPVHPKPMSGAFPLLEEDENAGKERWVP